MAGGLNLPITTMFNDKGLKQAQMAFGKFGGAIKGILGAAGLSLGVGALVKGINDLTKAAVEDQKSQALLANQLKNTVQASDAVTASVEDQITKMSLVSSVADDKIRPAYASLIRSTRSVKDATRLTTLALDISAATGKDLTAVSIALGKAYNGSTTALSKLGIKVKDTKRPFDELEKAFAGSAETAAKNDPYQRLAVIFDELKETIGKVFIPALNSIADWFTNNFDGIKTFFDDAFKSKAFGDLADVGKRLYDEILVPLGKWFMSKDVQEAISEVAIGIAVFAQGALDIASSGFGQFIKTITGDVIVSGMKSLAQAFTQIGDALRIISGKSAIFEILTGAPTAVLPSTQKNAQADLKSLLGVTAGLNASNPILSYILRFIQGKLPAYASGGIVPATPGGQLSLLGEGGQAEAVIPLDRLDAMMRPASTGGAVYQITVNAGVGDKAAIGKAVVDAVKAYERQSGAGWRQ